jgi:hypothetical protein
MDAQRERLPADPGEERPCPGCTCCSGRAQGTTNPEEVASQESHLLPLVGALQQISPASIQHDRFNAAMNFMTWASSVLDSVDEQATEKVGEIKKEIEKGAPVNLATATKLLGLDRQQTGSTASTVAASASSASTVHSDAPSASLLTSDHTSPAPPHDTPSVSPDAPPTLSIAGRSSPARPSRTIAGSASGEKGMSHSASATNLPKHGKEPSAKSQSAAVASAAARDEELLGLLNSNAPLPAATGRVSPAPRSGSPAPGGPQAMGLNTSRSASPVQKSRELGSNNNTPAASLSASDPPAITSATSSNFLSNIMQRVSPATSPAVPTRKLTLAKTEAASATPAQSLTSAFAAVASSASALASSVSSSNLTGSSTASSSTASNAASADLQAENARLTAESAELQNEVASLKQVWHDSRSQIAKLKGLLENAKEMYAAKLREADAEREKQMKAEREAMKAEFAVKEKEHVKALEEARKATAGSTNELGVQSAQLTKLKLDHARELAQRDHERRELLDSLEAERKRFEESENQLAEARVKLEVQSAEHVKQLSALHEETLLREQRAEEARNAHSQRLDNFESRGHQLESNNDEYITLIASLQRQLESAQREIDQLKAERRMVELKSQGEHEGLALAREKFDAAEKQHAQVVAGLQARLQALQAKNDTLTQSERDWRSTEEHLTGHIRQLEADLAAAMDATQDAASMEILSRTQEDEQRLKSMAEHLLAKSQALERTTAEKTSLRLQLENETTRVTNLEVQLRVWKEKYRALDEGGMMSHAPGGAEEADLEHGGGNSSSSSSSMVVSTRRGGSRSPKTSSYGAEGSHLTGLRSGNAVAKAVGFVDSMGQQVSTLLRRYPQVRIGFGIYVLLIHLYVAFVFVHLMHEFGGETHHGSTATPPGLTRSRTP